MTETPALTALALVCTLKASPEESSSDLLATQILEALGRHGVTGQSIRLADFAIARGVTTDEGDGDQWPDTRSRILAADILVVAPPTWVGQLSSVGMQLLERLDAELGETDAQGRPSLYDRVAVV